MFVLISQEQKMTVLPSFEEAELREDKQFTV